VAVRGVDDEQVDAGGEELLGAAQVARPCRRRPPTRSRPCSSLQALGNCRRLKMSLTVMRPRSRPVLVDDGQLLDAVAVEDALGFPREVPTAR
jgi:hypothetical protein